MTFIAGDPLRALAALSVVGYHVGYAVLQLDELPLDGLPEALGPIGWLVKNLDLGLYIFFVLSGYLITRPFLRAYLEGEPLPTTGTYVRNRLLRIVPAFWIVFTILLLLNGTYGDSPAEIGAVYLFAQNYLTGAASFQIGQAWTLSVELGFYLLVPLVAWWLAGRRGRLWFVLLACAAIVVASAVIRALGPDTITFARSLPAMLVAFVPGIVLAAIEPTVAPRAEGSRWAARLSLGLLALGAVALVGYALIEPRVASFEPGEHPNRILVAVLGTGCLVAAPLVWQWCRGTCWAILDNPPLRWLGERSYSIYLVHLGVFGELTWIVTRADSAKGGFAALLAVGLPATVLVAAVSYRFFERPFLERKVSRPLQRAGS